MQLIFDHWPLGASPSAEPLVGSTLALLSNVVPAVDGTRWELPRVEVTLPVFSLVGKGSVQLGRDRRVVFEAKGERTCKELRALLPPSLQLEGVRSFLDRSPGRASVSAREPLPRAELRIRWDYAEGRGAPAWPEWRFEPACGLVAFPVQP